MLGVAFGRLRGQSERNQNDAFWRGYRQARRVVRAGRRRGGARCGLRRGYLSQSASTLHQPLPSRRADRHAFAPVLRQDDRAHRPAMDRGEPWRRRRQCRHGCTRQVRARWLFARPGWHRRACHCTHPLCQAAVQCAQRLHLRVDHVVAAEPPGGQPRRAGQIGARADRALPPESRQVLLRLGWPARST